MPPSWPPLPMPMLVTKNVMAANFAFAGCAAIRRQVIAARLENAGQVFDAETGIGSSQLLLGRHRRQRSFRHQPVLRDIIPAQDTEMTIAVAKRASRKQIATPDT